MNQGTFLSAEFRGHFYPRLTEWRWAGVKRWAGGVGQGDGGGVRIGVRLTPVGGYGSLARRAACAEAGPAGDMAEV
jgi:hypothetical protein